jgi:hypothetical protein
MSDLPLGQMSTEGFDALIEGFISQRSGQDDRLPGDVFFELLARYQPAERSLSDKEPPARVRCRVLEGRLVLTAPADSPLRVEGNRIRWLDGHEMILELEPAATTGLTAVLREASPEWDSDVKAESSGQSPAEIHHSDMEGTETGD